jgi:hypothetical protein
MKFRNYFPTLESWKKPLWLRILSSLLILWGTSVVSIFVGSAAMSVLLPSPSASADSYQLALSTGVICFFASMPLGQLYEFLFLIPPKFSVPELVFKFLYVANSTLSAVALIAFIPLIPFASFFRDHNINPLAIVGAVAGAVFIVRMVYPYTLNYGIAPLEPLKTRPENPEALNQIRIHSHQQHPFTAIRLAYHSFELDLRQAEAIAHELCYMDGANA